MKPQTPDVCWHPLYARAAKRVEACENALAKARQALDGVRQKSEIRCCSCSECYPITTQTYIQTHWYTSPRGCTGGDYWNLGEAQWKCPKCGFVNRFDDRKDKYVSMPNEFYRPELVALKQFFKEVVNVYER